MVPIQFEELSLPLGRRWGGQWHLIGVALLGSTLVVLSGQRAQGQGITAATITEILDSNQVYIQNQRAQVNSVAQQSQRVSTQAARASLRFNTGAVARLAPNSSLVIGQCAQINRGTMLVNGTLNGCSTSTVAGVRGTIYTLEVMETGQTVIRVFEGQVVVEPNPNPNLEPPVLPGSTFDPADRSFNPVVLPVDPVVPFLNLPPVVDPPSPEPRKPPVDIEQNLPQEAFSSPDGLEVVQPLDDTVVALLGKVMAGPSAGLEDWTTTKAEQSETMGFTADDSLTVTEGQQVIIDAEQGEAVIQPLQAEDFIALLEGPLINGFAVEIPGIGNLRQSFERLFPGVPLPSLWAPPLPLPPLRFPFPF
jgi:hypothetical protein